jgi:hypothetical protein
VDQGAEVVEALGREVLGLGVEDALQLQPDLAQRHRAERCPKVLLGE